MKNIYGTERKIYLGPSGLNNVYQSNPQAYRPGLVYLALSEHIVQKYAFLQSGEGLPVQLVSQGASGWIETRRPPGWIIQKRTTADI